MIAAAAKSYWSAFAAHYELAGPPLRPSKADIGVMEAAVAQHAAAHSSRSLKALLFGVTPDIVHMRRPENVSLVALDNSWPMVSALWRENLPGRRAAVCGNWLSPPLPDGLFDIALGDGAFNCLPSFELGRAFASTIRGLLRPDGALSMRYFLQPAKPEDPAEIFEDLHRGAVASVNHLRLRLLMATPRNPDGGMSMANTYRYWANRNHNGRLPAGPGWEKDAVALIENYANSETRYIFPNLVELRSLFGEFFDETGVTYPAGSMGECCPVISMKPAARLR